MLSRCPNFCAQARRFCAFWSKMLPECPFTLLTFVRRRRDSERFAPACFPSALAPPLTFVRRRGDSEFVARRCFSSALFEINWNLFGSTGDQFEPLRPPLAAFEINLNLLSISGAGLGRFPRSRMGLVGLFLVALGFHLDVSVIALGFCDSIWRSQAILI